MLINTSMDLITTVFIHPGGSAIAVAPSVPSTEQRPAAH